MRPTKLAVALAAILLPLAPSAARADDRSARPTVEELAERVRACYRRGDRDAADRLIAADARLVTWDALPPGVTLEVRFRFEYEGGGLEVALARAATDLADDLAVCFPPGSFGVAADWPSEAWTLRPQDVAAVRAPVVVLPARGKATVRLPVFCAAMRQPSPREGGRHELRRFEPGSPIDRLMIAICAGDRPDGDAVQLAIWIVRDRIEAKDVRRPRGTMGPEIDPQRAWVSAADGPAAWELLRAAGIDTDALPFFATQAPPRADPVQTRSRARARPAAAARDERRPRPRLAPALRPAPLADDLS